MRAGSSIGSPAPAATRRHHLRGLVAALVVALGTVVVPPGSPPVARAADFPSNCSAPAEYMARADELLANRYLIAPHPMVTLPVNLTWAENPLREANWQAQFHSLRFVLSLFRAWHETGRIEYLDRGLILVEDWYRDNPRSNPPSPYSWHNGATAWRATVLACVADLVPMKTWLLNALVLHGRTLADPAFYVKHGNHALNQSVGLLEVGRVLGRYDWMILARDRINALVTESVDSQGVTNEQAVAYQAYNYRRYRHAQRRLMDVGLAPGSGFDRVNLMPRLMAVATLPSGQAEMLGNTENVSLGSVPGTWLEFVATQGASGPTPPLIKAFSAGYLFARSGWGTKRAWPDETFLSVRWGPGRRFHGHPDGASFTLYGWGSRLLVDPGKYTYTAGNWRDYFRHRRAHNVVTVDGLGWRSSSPTTLVGRTTTSTLLDIRLRTSGYPGVTHNRRITWSRGLDYLIVEDRLSSATRRTYRQLWHLVEDANPAIGTHVVRTRRTRGNVLIRQLVGSPALRVLSGRTSPIQGWISYRYGRRVAAPVVQAIRTGANVRYLTLIVPAQGRPSATVSGLRVTSDGYRVTITINGRSERVVARGSAISITPVAEG
jgi:hypothetical protein